jgi:sodium-dependent dicarboxylate transporter 2/3/5
MKTLILNKTVQLLIGLVIFFSILLTKGQDAQNPLMWKSIALASLMVYLWLLEVIPIYVTALLPLLFSSPLGIINAKDLASSYGDSNIYLFLGGFILAIALEKHNVHLQISKRIINLVGNTKSKLLLGFTFSTGLISMWISNTATALMMLPMGFAIVAALPKEEKRSKFSLLLILSIAYAASIGGAGTLIASPPNLIMASIINADPYNAGIDFITWAKFGIPISFTFLLLMYLTFNFLLGQERNDKINMDELKLTKWTKTQLRVLAIFGLVVFLWLTKNLFATIGFNYDDLFPAMLGSIALFVVPKHNQIKPLLNWKATKKIPWGVLILFGGGIAMAKTLQQHGAIDMIAASFVKFQHLNTLFVILILVTIAVFATELISNTALTNILVPVVAMFAFSSELSIYQLSIAVTLGASWAFMLPIGTPPNAIVFASGKVKMKDMLRYGFILNIISILLISLFAWLFL